MSVCIHVYGLDVWRDVWRVWQRAHRPAHVQLDLSPWLWVGRTQMWNRMRLYVSTCIGYICVACLGRRACGCAYIQLHLLLCIHVVYVWRVSQQPIDVQIFIIMCRYVYTCISCVYVTFFTAVRGCAYIQLFLLIMYTRVLVMYVWHVLQGEPMDVHRFNICIHIITTLSITIMLSRKDAVVK